MTPQLLQLKVENHYQLGYTRTSMPNMLNKIPDLINGLKLYVVNTALEDYNDDTADLQYFDMKTFSKAKYAGIQKGGICQGSWECPNSHCTFKALSVNN